MKKLILSGTLIAYSIFSSMAGGLLTNTNQSAHFLRNPARDASTEIDAAYTNPAGLSQLMDGFHVSISNQSAFQTRTISSTFAPFKGFGGSETKEFKGKTSAPIIPSLQAAFKKGKWVISANIAIAGGGGAATFDTGLPSFEAPISMVPGIIYAATNGTLPTGGYALNSSLKGSSIIYGAQVGGTYSINNMFAVYGGLRMSIVNNGYEGYLRDIKIGINNVLTPGEVLLQNPALGGLAPLLTSKELNVTQTGMGVSPILGVNFNHDKLNVGMKYEFRTKLTVENKKGGANTTGMSKFDDGVKTPHDIPALLTIGASYKILPQLTASVGFHQFFDSKAKMDNDKQKYIDGGVREYLGGLEYRICNKFLVSSGFQISRQGIKDDRFQSDLSYGLNSYSVGIGGAYSISEKIRVNAGYFWTNYSNWTKKVESNYTEIPGVPVPGGTDVFGRTSKAFGIGVDFLL